LVGVGTLPTTLKVELYVCVCVCASVCTLTVANNMQNTATHCNTTGLSGYSPDESQNRAVCNTLQYMCTPTGASNSTYCWGSATRIAGALQHTATAHCNTLHYTTAHCNTQCRHSWQTWTSAGSLAGSLQQHTAPQQQCTATHRNTRHRTATHDNTLQHTVQAQLAAWVER